MSALARRRQCRLCRPGLRSASECPATESPLADACEPCRSAVLAAQWGGGDFGRAVCQRRICAAAAGPKNQSHDQPKVYDGADDRAVMLMPDRQGWEFGCDHLVDDDKRDPSGNDADRVPSDIPETHG